VTEEEKNSKRKNTHHLIFHTQLHTEKDLHEKVQNLV